MREEKDYGKGSCIKAAYSGILLAMMFAVSFYLGAGCVEAHFDILVGKHPVCQSLLSSEPILPVDHYYLV